ncbi:MAG: YqeG family HAD IIIA-type phosphatase [Ruminococcus sp.]|nr:YqeG family HAD IIIA-type phosphatase [Ruminococcus sp.]
MFKPSVIFESAWDITPKFLKSKNKKAVIYISVLKSQGDPILFKPTAVFESVWDITIEFLRKHGINTLLLDADNTLSVHRSQTPFKRVPEWISLMKKAGIRLIIVSNSEDERIKPFAEKLHLKYISSAAKPLPKGYMEAVKKFHLNKKTTAAVGDQIFTDILGANLYGIKSIFVFPKEPEKSLPFRIKRFIEKPFLPKLK